MSTWMAWRETQPAAISFPHWHPETSPVSPIAKNPNTKPQPRHAAHWGIRPGHSAQHLQKQTAWWLLGTSVSCQELLGPLSCTRQARACLKDPVVSCPFPKKGPQPYRKTVSPPSRCLRTAEICLIACGWFSSSFPAVKLHYRQLKIHHILS